jgi:hypothetical protein
LGVYFLILKINPQSINFFKRQISGLSIPRNLFLKKYKN